MNRDAPTSNGALYLLTTFSYHNYVVLLSFDCRLWYARDKYSIMEVMKIGSQVKHARERSLLTQDELAKRAEIGAATVNRIEKDRVEPHFRTIRKIAKALGVDAHDLIGDDNE